jgi:hypothetical protein
VPRLNDRFILSADNLFALSQQVGGRILKVTFHEEVITLSTLSLSPTYFFSFYELPVVNGELFKRGSDKAINKRREYG